MTSCRKADHYTESNDVKMEEKEKAFSSFKSFLIPNVGPLLADPEAA